MRWYNDYQNYEVMEATVFRNKDWVFQALWATMGSSAGGKHYFHIPDTFLFRKGTLVKAIHCNPATSCIERIEINENSDIDRLNNDSAFRGQSLNAFRILRRCLKEYSERHGYYMSYEDEATPVYICKVNFSQ